MPQVRITFTFTEADRRLGRRLRGEVYFVGMVLALTLVCAGSLLLGIVRPGLMRRPRAPVAS